MKKFLGTITCVMLTLIVFAQSTKVPVKGIIKDATTHAPIAGALIQLGKVSTLSDEAGKFIFDKTSSGNYNLSVSSLGFKTHSAKLSVANKSIDVNIELESSSLFLQPLEVKSIRASITAPFAKTNLNKQEIASSNLGQDLPLLLNQTPSVVVNSDAGNGVGYTGIRIRGTDATRINVTLNGIPYNDAESMGTYFVDLPDFSSSVNSIQIQRGVGTSSNGASAFGATINLSTNEFNEKAYAEINNSFGSFNTLKNTVKVGSGLINNHFTIDARISSIKSDGFIDRANSNLQSFYVTGAYINKKSSLRFNIFSGKEKTYQAWYGVPEDMLSTNRTYNPAGTEKPGTPYDNQTDNYTQTHYQLFFNHAINTRWSFNTAVFLTKGNGYYEEYKADADLISYGLPIILPPIVIAGQNISTDIVRQRWLDNSFVGQIASLQYKTATDEMSFGGGWTNYQGQHFGKVIWIKQGTVNADRKYYDYPATKTDANIYAKWQHKLTEHWQSFIDLQYRLVSHNMQGFEGTPNLNINRSFNFVNPKAGITYTKNGWQGFLSYAIGNKEPNRDDFQASLIHQPKAETLYDVELGIEKKNTNFHYGATLYFMNYTNQLVLTGEINDVGSYTRTNIPKSYRLGLELQAELKLSNWFNLSSNFSVSQNKIKSFTEFIDNYDTGLQDAFVHNNTNIAFSPNMVGGLSFNFQPCQYFELSLLNKYVGKQYMDNTQNEKRKLDGYFTQDLRMTIPVKNKLFKEWKFIGQINNLYNAKYQPNGYTYNYIYNNQLTSENGYYPMAGTNFMLALNINL